jgi:hypothetical protein
MTLKALAARCQALGAEIEAADAALKEFLDRYAPKLCDFPGVGTEVASQLLITFGDNPDRLENEAQFASLVGVAPVPASSGKTTRHRLSRGGDRNANNALHHVNDSCHQKCPVFVNIHVTTRTCPPLPIPDTCATISEPWWPAMQSAVNGDNSSPSCRWGRVIRNDNVVSTQTT